MEFTGERMIPEFNEGSKIYLEHVNRYIFAKQFVKDKDVLDIACGSGYGTELLLGAGAKSVLGVDISKEAVKYCKNKYPKINFKVGSVDDIPVEDESMDVVVSFETIEHVDEKTQQKFMQEVNRVLKNDGIFVVSTPNALVYEKGNEFHMKELTPDELDVLLKKYGFEYNVFFQDSIDSNYIFSAEQIEKKTIIEENNVVFENKENRLSWDARYLVVVCSKSKDKLKALGSIYISNFRSLRYTEESIKNFYEIIGKRDSEIDKIKNSKLFRIENLFFRSIKNPKKILTFPINTSRIIFDGFKNKLHKKKEIRKYYCPICGEEMVFNNAGDPVRINVLCSSCESLERHRFLYYIYASIFMGDSRNINLLHMAPEKCLHDILIKKSNINYTAADLTPGNFSYAKCDKEDFSNMTYEDKSFDVILANQVLEHIEKEKECLLEIKRCLKDDGCAIINVPFSQDLSETYEDSSIKTEELRKIAYGQSDHVRLYGTDVAKRFEEAGFNVNQIDTFVYPRKFVNYCKLECNNPSPINPGGYFILRKRLS